jgi:DNA-binding NtrC family response regulator
MSSDRRRDPAPLAILVVDDDSALRGLVRRVLERQGWTVYTASAVAEAKTLLAQMRDGLGLLLTDVAMPGGLGPDLVTDLSTLQPDVRVLYMSSYAAEDLAYHGVSLGDRPHLRKPFTPEQLVTAVCETLGQRERGHGKD